MATVTITHSRLEGTLIEGSVKGDGVWEVVKTRGFRSSRSVGLYVPRSRDREADMWRINGAKAALEADGHTVTVEIDEEARRTFAEAEDDRVQQAEDRAERYSGYADNAARSSDARHERANQIARRFEGGQPILVGHHSEGRARRDQERIHTNMRASIADGKRADHWQNRVGAAENYEKHRKDPYRTLRRLEKLRADLRAQLRVHGEPDEVGSPSDRHGRLVRDLREEIAYWEDIVAKAEAAGVKIWRPDDFAPGDYALYHGSWFQVARVNPKTLSIAWNLRLHPKQVMTLEDATENGETWTHTADYTNVRARCPEKAMHAFLADEKVPGTKAAREASAAAPAEEVRAAQAEAKKKKPKQRTDPKIPKKIRVDCGWDATEATLTWLNGAGRPHPDHPAETIHAPEGAKFGEAANSRTLLSQVTAKVKERGLMYRGRWNGGPRSLVHAVVPDPEAEAKEPTTEDPDALFAID
ncbi:DUF3560 domain-containing protein [Streptomyces sp. NPDC053560]|uniref:DUF3560 domain-containing protein n=1 Tax=Streptomyces sp. NPDC053560 TaxID=3365711 RepID=UPI0037CD901E